MMRDTVEDLDDFRAAVRRRLSEGVLPDKLLFVAAEATQQLLWDSNQRPESGPPSGPGPRLPRVVVEAVSEASVHRDPDRWNLYYRLLWRAAHGERAMLELAADPDVVRLNNQLAAVRKDIHKMHAFVRFKRVVEDSGEERFVAAYRPDHRILRQAAPFFARRFASMRWSILTPDESAHWDGGQLAFGPPAPLSEIPEEDALEALWKTYYAHVFNPARLNVKAMKTEMPVRFWHGLPEAGLIPELVRQAPKRTERMVKPEQLPSASAAMVPPASGLEEVRAAAKGCTACPIYSHATQTVFGEGPVDSPLLILGEQPGDQEDRIGRPFAGPAGQLLDRFLAEAGIDRSSAYVTNAVKHFKWVPSGKHRIHQRPDRAELHACRGWLDAELRAVSPKLVLCLGITAGQALLGPAFKLCVNRGRPFQLPNVPWGLTTFHPSALLRATPQVRSGMEAAFRQDLAQVAAALALRMRSASAPLTT